MSRRTRMIVFVASGVVCIACVCVGALLYLRSSTSTPVPVTSAGPTTPAHQATAPMLALPNATPIMFEHRDYKDDTSIWVIVSKSRPLHNTQYVPSDLEAPDVPLNTAKSREEQSLRREAARAVEQFLGDASKAGHQLFLASGYRSYALQKQYYDNYVASYGQREADTFSARPGHSEHQTGLAFDIADASRTCYLETCFESMPSAQWAMDHAATYGLILRYTKEKVATTGYIYEPWHYRYVGVPLATALRESRLTLDEVLPYFESLD